MRTQALRVMALQPFWTDKNTVEMQERGTLIRSDIPVWLRSHQTELIQALGKPVLDFIVEGRDGTGRKTEIPWIRFCSESHSPSATEGWYCVYLFEAKGDVLYLCLIHGATRFIDGEFKPRSGAELQNLVTWARKLLHQHVDGDPRIVESISLHGRTKLGPLYEQSTALAIRYTTDNLPSSEQLLKDAISFARLLGIIYAAQDTGNAPETVSPEIFAAMQLMDEVTKPLRKRKGTGQGFGLTAQERHAVELCAMSRAEAYLHESGYTTTDVSASESYDLLATNGQGQEYVVEVKGTTSGPAEIVLTINEVQLNQSRYPHTFLIVVHGVCLDRSQGQPTASGGELLVIHPWRIEIEHLSPLSFRYQVPTQC